MTSLQPRRILVVKLSDIGDVLTATPALRALRQSFPQARLEALTPPRSATILQGSPLLDEVIVFDKFAYDQPGEALRLGALWKAFRFLRQLRARRYDLLVLLHHLSTPWGALKWAALALMVGAPVRAGLDNGRGWFLTHRVSDEGFGAKHEVEHNLAVVNAIGAHSDDRRMSLTVSERDETAVMQMIQQQLTAVTPQAILIKGLPSAISPLPRAVVAVHPGSGGHNLARRWPLERWVKIGQALAERNVRVIIVGTRGDGCYELAKQLPYALNLSDKTSLPQLAALLKQCDLFVGADSGVMHVAAAAGVPVVALFGVTNPKAWGPWLGGHETQQAQMLVVQSETPGCPCAYMGFDIQSDECDARDCMSGISVERVLAAVEALLERVRVAR